MTRKKKPLPILENITITDYAAEGKAVARVDDMVVFVPWAVPGDVVDLQVRRKKHSFMEAEVVKYHVYSKVRTQPFCRHFGVCGGCKWQQIPYEEQLRMKQQQVFDQLTRIGKIALPAFTERQDAESGFRPILGSVKTREYRNKLDFGCANKRYLTKEEIDRLPHDDAQSLKDVPAIGFHITGAFDKILPIEKCWLMDDQQVGLLRDVIIRNSASGEWLVILQFHLGASPTPSEGGENRWEGEDGRKALALLQHIADTFPQITSLMYLDNQKCNDTIGDQEILTFKGKDHIYEIMEDLRFKVGPKSFYQTNTEQAYHLYSVVRELAGLSGEQMVYDLYTGTGTIANFVAKRARQVVGIEYVPEAIEDAKVNSKINGIGNTVFYAGDMKDPRAWTARRHHHRPAACRHAPRRGEDHTQRCSGAHCLCELQSRHTGPRPTDDGRTVSHRCGAAGRYVPAYAARGKRGVADETMKTTHASCEYE